MASTEREPKRRTKEGRGQGLEEVKRRKVDKGDEKKVRNQLSLNAFFTRSKQPAASTNRLELPIRQGNPSDAQVELESISRPEPEPKDIKTYYQREFQPFFIKAHVTVAPINRLIRSRGAIFDLRKFEDAILKQTRAGDENLDTSSSPVLGPAIPRRPRCRTLPTVKDIAKAVSESKAGETKFLGIDPSYLLREVPIKYLQLPYDRRPLYCGTFSKPLSAASATRLAKDPLKGVLSAVDYEGDSEAEWEDSNAHDAEDLHSGDELDSDHDDEDDEMSGFLDDAEVDPNAFNSANRRRLINGNLEPANTGLCWEDENRANPNPELHKMRMQPLLETALYPINPLSSDYWPATHATVAKATSQLAPNPSRMLIPSVMDEFKEAVVNSRLTKAGLIEILKMLFPKLSKPLIKDTLTRIAVRKGARESEKRWVLIEGS